MPAQTSQAEFSESLLRTADDVWNRFVQTMPERYFQETDRETQLSHLHVLTACLATGIEQDLVVRSQDGDTYTFLTGRSYPGQLGEMLERLPPDRSLSSARAYTSKDGRWVLDIFELGEKRSRLIEDREFETLCSKLSQGISPEKRPAFRLHLQNCAAEYLRAVPARIAQIHFDLACQAQESGDVVVQWERINADLDTIRLTVEGNQAKTFFQRLARYLGHNGIDIERAYVTSFHGASSTFLYLGFTLRGADASHQERITEDLKRLYYLDNGALELWSQTTGWSLVQCEVVDTLLSLAHQLLSTKDPVKYARPRLVQAALKHSQHFSSFVESFITAGQAPLDNEGFDRDEERDLFRVCRQILEATTHHNLDQEGRQALGLRLNPSLFRANEEEKPYAVIFARGRDALGFHVRFQDVARGGLRLVCPRSVEAHNAELERLFDEAYSLARAQHLKNKDIPEGGAKAAVLVRPGADPTFAGKCFANTLLDLTVGLAQNSQQEPDLIYLGPDENVSTHLIEWIAHRALLRGHPLPSAFMSSKPGAGINHKEFGITSEGVTVFLEESLRQAGIDPCSQPFTIKITGGPDGDVAGNQIRILATRYPETARIIGIGDGSGVAEDPQGLDHGELIRLFENTLPIAHFNKGKLSERGRVVSVEEPAGVALRNSLHNRLQSDAFVPGGGRPSTINSHNWRDFFALDGTPSSRVVVEGANLFLTDQARTELASLGVSIIKDSSANKCGVVCSSFEVLASMLLTEAEFLAHKKEFVAQVIERLRHLARSEAKLLFREHKRRPDLSLPALSVRLSKVMLRTAEAVAQECVDPLSDTQGGTREVFEAYLPPLLRTLAGDRLHQIPVDYRQRILACSLSGKIVYREGITYLEDLPQEALCHLALTYLRSEKVVRDLIEEVRASGLASSDQLAELLELGGARTIASGLS